jgi:hypothetical protein
MVLSFKTSYHFQDSQLLFDFFLGHNHTLCSGSVYNVSRCGDLSRKKYLFFFLRVIEAHPAQQSSVYRRWGSQPNHQNLVVLDDLAIIPMDKRFTEVQSDLVVEVRTIPVDATKPYQVTCFEAHHSPLSSFAVGRLSSLSMTSMVSVDPKGSSSYQRVPPFFAS